MTTTRHKQGGWIDDGKTKRAACRQCGGPIPERGRRRTFCSAECVHEYKLRTDAGYLRLKVFERDDARCASCGIDCLGVDNQLRCGPKWFREAANGRNRAEWLATRPRRARGTGHLWQADHIIPVVEGGGQCDLDNLRTLCTACHKAETAALRVRMARRPRRRTSISAGARR